MICPNCGSPFITKKGFRAGKQRYKCKVCSACFTEGVPYEKANTYEKELSIKCPDCGSYNIIRGGKLKDGTPRYLCKNCRSRFSDKTLIYGKRKTFHCPYCGSFLRLSGYGKKGQREYFCSTCRKSCSGDSNGNPIANLTFAEVNENIECPTCNSKNLRKLGIVKGKQRYKCKDCNRIFIENPQILYHSKKQENEAIKEVFKGKKLSKVAEKYGYSTDRLREIVSPLYKNEHLTTKQKMLILKYGHFLKVPVEYLAEYVPCSERACRELLQEFKNKLSPPTLMPS